MCDARANVLAYPKQLSRLPVKRGVPQSRSTLSKDPFTLPQLLHSTQKLNLHFYARPAEMVARELLGSVLLHNELAGMIVETEAYLGLDDLAAHASRGRTERNRVLFGPAGYTYVYLIYGIHECLNVSAKPDDAPGCVLIRALEPLCGLRQMYERRNWHGPVNGLANGPGKLTMALGITRAHYGLPVDEGSLTIRQWKEKPSFDVDVTPRIGITKCADWPLRFLVHGNRCVSKPYSFSKG